jgi:hypothetical protein
VDGTENPMSNLYTQKMHEVQKHLTLSDHGYLGYAVIVNKKFWEDLPADIRATLTKAMDDATVFERKIAQEENDMALAKVKAAGTTRFIPCPTGTAWFGRRPCCRCTRNSKRKSGVITFRPPIESPPKLKRPRRAKAHRRPRKTSRAQSGRTSPPFNQDTVPPRLVVGASFPTFSPNLQGKHHVSPHAGSS